MQWRLMKNNFAYLAATEKNVISTQFLPPKELSIYSATKSDWTYIHGTEEHCDFEKRE